MRNTARQWPRQTAGSLVIELTWLPTFLSFFAILEGQVQKFLQTVVPYKNTQLYWAVSGSCAS